LLRDYLISPSVIPRIQLQFTGAYHDLDYQRPGAELKILFGPVHRSWAQCDRLFDETIYPVACTAIAAAIDSAEDFLQHRLIQISTHRINWNQILQSVGIDTMPGRQFCFVDNTQIAMAMAAAGYGIALARSPTTDDFAATLGLEPIAVCPGVQSTEAYYLVYQNLESLSGAAGAFREWLLERVKNQN